MSKHLVEYTRTERVTFEVEVPDGVPHANAWAQFSVLGLLTRWKGTSIPSNQPPEWKIAQHEVTPWELGNYTHEPEPA